MAVLSLPLTFTNSFWTQDYRRGLQVLYNKLEQGVAENEEIVAFVKARAAAERNIADSLINPLLTGRRGMGFEADDGASLLMAFRGLQVESVTQGQAHSNIAKELTSLVVDPFQEWASGYKNRLKQSKAHLLDDWLPSYEQDQAGVATLKQQYLAKVRKADEAEDDAKFAPTSNPPTSDKFTNSPRLRPADRLPPQRTPSVSQRIAQRLKEIQKRSVDTLAQVTASEDVDAPTPPELEVEEQEKPLPKIDKGKGKEVDTASEKATVDSPPPLTPPPKDASFSGVQTQSIVLADLSFTPVAVAQLLTKASTELPLRPVRFPLLGEYQDAFTGDEFVAWLKVNVAGLDGSLDKAGEMARDLTEREGLLRRLGELGNSFEDSEEAFYQFRPKAFQIEKLDPSLPQDDSLLKRTGTLYSFVSKALNTTSSEPAYVRARQEANEADNTYRVAVRKLDRYRLALEERIEEALKVIQRWEIERLRAVKTVLLQYHGILFNLPKSLEPSLERSTTLLSAFQPEQDLVALVERYRTGPFRPNPQVYESVSHEELDVVFGIDLRKWSEGGWYASFASMQSDEEEEKKEVTKKDLVPPVLAAMLAGLESAYERSANDAEKRKAWIYEVPLGAVHQLRESLNTVQPGQPYSPDIFAKFDTPVIAACVKLWVLELNPPLAMYEGWEEFRKLYQARKSDGDAASGEDAEKEHLERVASTLQRLPRVHLYVLDAILVHLRQLVAATKVEESDEIYFTKLGLSMGRGLLRPKTETEFSIQDRHPTSLMMDLLKHYDTILPPTLARKKRESERKLPMRKRTAPTDMRLSRSKITTGADAGQLLAAQQIAQNPSLANKGAKSPEIPSLPLPSPPVAVARVPSPASNLPVPPPPPPSILNQLKTPPPPPRTSASPIPPPPPPLSGSIGAAPARPAFKEPPPEFDVLPIRPSFKEPPPELDDLPPRPSFADPPPEDSDEPDSSTTPSTNVIPPTPQKATRMAMSPNRLSSRSPTPPSNAGSEDVVLGKGKPNISRVGSGPATSGIRGPRIGARPTSSNVQSLVQNLNRSSISGSPGPVPTSPKANRFSGTGSATAATSAAGRVGSPVRRPSSIVGRNAMSFSRRTMASDAEDDVVDKK